MRVSGSGFPANARIDIDFSGRQLGITTTNGDGKFSNFAVTIPADTSPDNYELDVTEQSGAADTLVPFTVPKPSVVVSPESGAAGTVVHVSASDFPADTRVEITFQALPIGEATTAADGKISNVAVTIPADFGSLGPRKFPLDVQVQSDGAIYAEKLFTVTG